MKLTRHAPATLSRDDWRAQAVCATADDPDLWHPDGATGQWSVRAEDAKAICRQCPVMARCGQWALSHRVQHGIWGGLDETDRDRLRRADARTRAKGTR